MGLTQDFAGQIEPDDPAWLRADSGTKRRYYDAAGMIVLDELAKQLGKGVGRNGRQMKARIQPVLADGADGPVMEPHYSASRVITLADYAATDHGVKLFWHAGTGHRTHRRARAKGQKATPFGEILQYHADGMVPHAPVRDVRLCAARIQNVRNKLKPVWKGLLKTGRFAPIPQPQGPRKPTAPTPPTLPTAPTPKRVDQGHEVPGPPHPHPTPAPKRPEAPKAPVFKPGQFNPPPVTYTGEHPTPTHPIPVVTKVPKSRVKGPIFVVSGGGGAKGKAPAPKPAPKTPSLPPRKAPVPALKPVPVPVPVPVMAQPLPNPFEAPKSPIESAILFARAKGIDIEVDANEVRRVWGSKADQVIAMYQNKADKIVINPEHVAWGNPGVFMHSQHATGWFSTAHPEHIIHHEVGHALHRRWLGYEAYRDTADAFANAQETATALKVSRYAATEPLEFVAEVYAGRVAGRPFDPDVLKLYDKYGGPGVVSAQPRRRAPVLPVPSLPRPSGPQLQV